MFTLTVATVEDIEKVLELHYRYQVDSIKEEDKKDGFVATRLTKEELQELIEKEQGLFIAKINDEVVAYVMAASWLFWSRWPMFAYMIEHLSELEYMGQTLNTENSYQYGPIGIDKAVRGSGVLEQIFDFARQKMAKRYPILVTLINKVNTRSYMAHTKKLGLEVLREFCYNNNDYYELVYGSEQ